MLLSTGWRHLRKHQRNRTELWSANMSRLTFILTLLQVPAVLLWTDYQTVNIQAYTRIRSNGSVDQGVVVLVNDAIFAYFDSGNKTFVLRPSATMGFSVLGESDRTFCLYEVLHGFYRQKDYLSKLREKTGGTKPLLVRPSVNVYPQFPVTEGQANVLYCYATGFYPGDIEINFFLNGRPSAEDGIMSDLMYSEDWTYRVYKYMAITPRPGEEYSCEVKHSSMAEPKMSLWRPEFPAFTPGFSWIFGLIPGLVCGIIVSAVLFRRKLHFQL
uniref:Beta-2-microglobulin n=2 Tax=Astyanax mexicanus TaxID=7994 RepID=W5KID6_ASTMX